jgi:hypothetical protein
MEAADVLPEWMTSVATLAWGAPSLPASDSMMRRFAWCGTNAASSVGAIPAADIHLAVGTPSQENLAHTMTRIRVSQMLLIDAFQNALAARLGVTAHAETMMRTVTQYTYIRPD